VRFSTADDLGHLIAHGIPESGSLEFKEALPLGAQKERLEALKDLTGMANGGGGTVLFGLREDRDAGHPVAAAVTPLTDFAQVGILEDIVRSGVRPPLLVEYTTIKVEGGYVLAVDVQHSPLGPYMVESYGHHTYYTRVGTRTGPMSEQAVRDAYTLAARAAERRPQLWTAHSLPITPPPDGPWLTLSALPDEPLTQVLDLRSIEPDQLQPPSLVSDLLGTLGFETSRLHLRRWADGYFGTDSAGADRAFLQLRVYRDGAIGLAVAVDPVVAPWGMARLLNALIAYIGWVWATFGLARPVEIRCALGDLQRIHLDLRRFRSQQQDSVVEPPGVSVRSIETTDYLLSWDIARASVRHAIVHRFIDRLYQAFGLPGATFLFRQGRLYDHTGTATDNLFLTDAGIMSTTNQLAFLHDDGFLTATSSGQVIGWVEGGVVMDLGGNARLVLEMAPGRGCPDDFLAYRIAQDPRLPAVGHVSLQPATGLGRPTATGSWSETSVIDALGPAIG